MRRKETAPALKGSKPHLGAEKLPGSRTWQDEEETEFAAIQKTANSCFSLTWNQVGMQEYCCEDTAGGAEVIQRNYLFHLETLLSFYSTSLPTHLPLPNQFFILNLAF